MGYLWRQLRFLFGFDRTLWSVRVVRTGDEFDVTVGILSTADATPEELFTARAEAWGETCRRMGRRVPCPPMPPLERN